MVSSFQSNVTVGTNSITGSLNFMEGGLSPAGPLSGDGYFLALKFSNFSEGTTYENCKVGLVPSMGTGLVALDSDMNCVFKITDKNTQKIAVETSTDTDRRVKYYTLSGLTLVSE